MAIDQVVARTQFAIGEPLHVAMVEGARLDGGEVLVPGYEVAREIAPKPVRILDGFFVHLLVLLESMDVRNGGVTRVELGVLEFLCFGGFNYNLYHTMLVISAEQ